MARRLRFEDRGGVCPNFVHLAVNAPVTVDGANYGQAICISLLRQGQ
jgi:hypothetical protein